jgi:hypothetical protein
MIMEDIRTNIITVIKPRRVRWIGNTSLMEETKTAYGVLAWIPETHRLFQRPTGRRVDSNKMDIQETGREGVD